MAANLTFDQTCFAAPEQYDILDSSGERVGYMRLRHGLLYISRVRNGQIARKPVFVREFPLSRQDDLRREELDLLREFGHVDADGCFSDYEHRDAYKAIAKDVLA